jgi:hypothetical protein
MTVAGTDFKTYINGQIALEYALPEPVSGEDRPVVEDR